VSQCGERYKKTQRPSNSKAKIETQLAKKNSKSKPQHQSNFAPESLSNNTPTGNIYSNKQIKHEMRRATPLLISRNPKHKVDTTMNDERSAPQ
jgi:hypothetical protein